MAIKKKFPYKAAFVACNGGCRAKDCKPIEKVAHWAA